MSGTGGGDALLPFAYQSDIMRASTKDESYQAMLMEHLTTLAGRLFGNQAAARVQDHLPMITNALYFGLTTLAGKQTMGEEYCSLELIDRSDKLPALRKRLLFFVLRALAPHLSQRAIGVVHRATRPRPGQDGSGGVRGFLHDHLPQARKLVDLALRIHLALFYFGGAYYDFSKRVAGIRYVYGGSGGEARPWMGFLGLLLSLQLAGGGATEASKMLQAWRAREQSGKNGESRTDPLEVEADARACTLCLEPRDRPAATPCGHVFCWRCIAEWCSTKPECPLCRQAVAPSSLLPVYHYSARASDAPEEDTANAAVPGGKKRRKRRTAATEATETLVEYSGVMGS